MNVLTMPLTMQAWEWLVVCVIGNLAYCVGKDLYVSAKALIHKINLRKMHHSYAIGEEDDSSAVRITITPAAVYKAMGQNQDPEQFILQMLQSSGVPVEDAGTKLVDGKMTAHVLKLTKGVIYRWDNWNEIIYEWRSK